jgi:hypothetical protein
MKVKKGSAFIFTVFLLLGHGYIAFGSNTQTRIDNDIANGHPIVIQVSVALADNKHQWIVPVPEAIGNGQNARTNLYWGARYGIKTYLVKDGGWEIVLTLKPSDSRILERIVFKKDFLRNGRVVPVYLVADAWDGKYISDTIKHFLDYTAGKDAFTVQLKHKAIRAGGNAHLVVYMGHNALMDYAGSKDLTVSNPEAASDKKEKDAIVLACKSEKFFLSRLKKTGANPLVLTTGLMAPEAYSLHAAIGKWVDGKNDIQVKKAAASSYNKYQKTGQNAAERLFGVRQ